MSASTSQTIDTSTTTEKAARTVLGYKDALKQWWSQPSQFEAEDGVFRLVKGIPADRTVQHEMTDISVKATVTGGAETEKDKVYQINEYSIKSEKLATAKTNKNLVILHGYGAGLAFFFKNFGALATGLGPNWDIYALDWLGYGGSSRPKFKIKTQDMSKTQDVSYPSPLDPTGQKQNVLSENVAVRETEDWFIESLEAWRKAKKLEKLVLMGHSMGGYLAAVYAMRYPERVENLVLVSPAGVEYGYDPNIDNQHSFKKAFLGAGADDDLKKENVRIEREEDMVETEFGPRPKNWRSADARRERFGPKLAYLWNSHISPFFLVRSSSFFGPRLVSYWSYNRFQGFLPEETEAMHTYAYKTFSAKGSGEYAITRLLAPGAMPRMPLAERVGPNFGLLKCPSLWMYGSHDWMDSDSGEKTVVSLNELDKRVQLMRQNNNITNDRSSRKAEFLEVPQAGHHLYLDNPSVFNRAVIRYLLK